MNERNDVVFPLWRKKVDRSLIEDGVTPIPIWMSKVWHIYEDYRGVGSIRNPKSIVEIEVFGEPELFKGSLTIQAAGRGGRFVRLKVDEATQKWLKAAYRTAHCEFVGTKNTGIKSQASQYSDFLDIEYSRENRRFRLRDYYKRR